MTPAQSLNLDRDQDRFTPVVLFTRGKDAPRESASDTSVLGGGAQCVR